MNSTTQLTVSKMFLNLFLHLSKVYLSYATTKTLSWKLMATTFTLFKHLSFWFVSCAGQHSPKAPLANDRSALCGYSTVQLAFLTLSCQRGKLGAPIDSLSNKAQSKALAGKPNK